jgi:single-strand DNA-binding protein
MSFNKVVLLGNLTADPEVRTTPSGSNVTSFSIAVNRRYRNRDGEQQEEVSYIGCTAWGPQGETIARYFSKGRQILICGRLRQDRWKDKDTGKNRSSLSVVVEEFSFAGNRDDNAGDNGGYTGGSYGSNQANNSANTASAPAGDTTNTIAADDLDNPINLDDIPF